MKKARMIVIMLVLIILMLNLNATISKAAGETFKADLSTTTKTIEKGQEFEVLISFSDISSNNGFTLIEGDLIYDENILEYVSDKHRFVDAGEISEMQELTVNPYEDGGSKISIAYLDANVKNLILKFKAKDNITVSNTTIRLENLKASNIDYPNVEGTAGGVSLTLNINQPTRVDEQNIAIETIALDKTKITLKENETLVLVVNILPENATNKEVFWYSSDRNVADVDQGKVTAKKTGNATITVSTQDESKKATCEIEVQKNSYINEQENIDKSNVPSNNNVTNNENQKLNDTNNNNQPNNEIKSNNVNESKNNKEPNKTTSLASENKNIQKNDNKNDLPYTGVNYNLLIPIIILCIIAIIMFIKNKKLEGIK